jgi:hypothetical protein
VKVPFDKFASLASNELLVQRWFSLFGSPQLIELSDAVLDCQDQLRMAHVELTTALKTLLVDVVQIATNTVPDFMDKTSLDVIVEVMFTMLVAERRHQREQQRAARSFKLIVEPLDGGDLDPEHLQAVADATADGRPTGDAWRALADRLAACKRPARAWTPEHEIHVDLDEDEDEDENEDGIQDKTTPVLMPAPEARIAHPLEIVSATLAWSLGCDQCVRLGLTQDEEGHPCQLYFCACANNGTILVQGAMGVRAVPCDVVRQAPATSLAPQVEGLRRAIAARLLEEP